MLGSPSPLGEGLGWGLAASDALGETSPTPYPSPEGEGLLGYGTGTAATG